MGSRGHQWDDPGVHEGERFSDEQTVGRFDWVFICQQHVSQMRGGVDGSGEDIVSLSGQHQGQAPEDLSSKTLNSRGHRILVFSFLSFRVSYTVSQVITFIRSCRGSEEISTYMYITTYKY